MTPQKVPFSNGQNLNITMQTILASLLTAGAFLAATGLAAWLLLRFCYLRDSRLLQVIWALVLLQGVVVWRLPVELPLLEPQISVSRTLQNTTPEETFIPVPRVELTEARIETIAPLVQKAEKPFVWTTNHTVMLLMAIWLGGFVILFWIHIYSWLSIVRRQCAVHLSGHYYEHYQSEWQGVLREENVRADQLRLIVADSTGPGLFKTWSGYSVIVPEKLWQEASPDARRGILRHEISHYRHGDVMKAFLLRFIVMLHWFNPVAWLALRCYENAVEERCDQEAFGRYPQGSAHFAEAMLAFRDTVPVTAVWRHAFFSSNIMSRAKRLMENNNHPKGDSLMKKCFILSVTALLFALGLFQFELTAQNAETKITSAPQVNMETEAKPDYSFLDKKVTMRGKVVLPDGRSGKGFMIRYSAQSKIRESTGWSGNNFVAEDGTFSLTHIPAQSHGIISILDPEHKLAAPHQTFSVDDKDLEEEIVFTFKPGIKISGTVRDKATGKAISNVEMTLQLRPKGNNRHLTPFDQFTDKNGRFEWMVSGQENTIVTVGKEYGVGILDQLKHTDLPESLLQDFRRRADKIKDIARLVEFDTATKDVVLDFSIPAPFVGKVLNVHGFPAQNVLVHLAPYGEHQLGSMNSHPQTDEAGTFRSTITPENVYVRIYGRNDDYYFRFFDKELLEDKEHVFQLQPTCVVKGRLMDAQGKPLADQKLFCFASKPNRPETEVFTFQQVKTDKDGHFALQRNVAANIRYVLYTSPSGNWQIDKEQVCEFMLEKPGETLDLGDVVVKKDESLVEKLVAVAKPRHNEVIVTGQVFMPDGSPAKKASVTFQTRAVNNSASHGHHTITDENGKYYAPLMGPEQEIVAAQAYVSRFLEGVTPSDKARYEGKEIFEPLVSEVVATFCPKNEATTLDFQLKEAYPLTGTVHYADGTPTQNALVSIHARNVKFGHDERFEEFADTEAMFGRGIAGDTEGNFKIFLAPGVYDVFLMDGMVGKSQVITIEPEKEVPPLELTAKNRHFIQPLRMDGSSLFKGNTFDMEPYRAIHAVTWKFNRDENGKIISGGVGSGGRANDDGNLEMNLNETNQYLFLMSDDFREGFAGELPGDLENLAVYPVQLAPPATAILVLVDENKKPLADCDVRYYVSVQRLRHGSGGLGGKTLRSDENGVIRVPVPALGKLKEVFSYKLTLTGVKVGAKFSAEMDFAPEKSEETLTVLVVQADTQP